MFLFKFIHSLSLKINCHINSPKSKAIIPLRCKGLLGMKENEKFLTEIGNPILKKKEINIYSYSNDRMSL